MTRPIADFVVSLGSDGRVKSQGPPVKALKTNETLFFEALEESGGSQNTSIQVAPAEIDSRDSKGKLVMKEEISEGHVGFQARESDILLASPPLRMDQ